jgi:hypothetical protein
VATTKDELLAKAAKIIKRAQEETAALMEKGLIPPAPSPALC